MADGAATSASAAAAAPLEDTAGGSRTQRRRETSRTPRDTPLQQTAAASETAAGFRVVVSGELAECSLPGRATPLLARFEFVFGADWSIVGGAAHGITQTATPAAENFAAVWNHPLDVAFSSRNPSGWPQIVVAVFGPDSLGRDVVRGYAAEHVPLASGRFERLLPMWVPQHASALEGALGVLTGRRAEYVDPKFAARGPGREVTKTRSMGHVKVVLEVVLSGMQSFGYSSL